MMPAGVDLALWAQASRLRKAYWGDNVYLRGIVEFSNFCRQNCLYCGLRHANHSLTRYALSAAEIFAGATAIRELGFGTVVLQAGEGAGLDGPESLGPDHMSLSATDLARLIERIKTELDLAVTLSLGEHSRETYALWRAAGADRYLLKLETVDEDLYARLRPGRRLPDRLAALEHLADLDYETGSGLIIGLPGENPETLTRGLEFLAGLRLDMVSMSPFTPAPGTPLDQAPACTLPDILNAMARTRLLMPKTHIPVTSALGLHGDAVRLAALAVGDVLMPSLTPTAVRGNYAIYAGKNSDTQDPALRAAAMRDLLLAAGFYLPTGPGGAWRRGSGNHTGLAP